MDRCKHCGEMLLVEHRPELGADRPAGEDNPHLVARCPNPKCPSHRAGAEQSGEPSTTG